MPSSANSTESSAIPITVRDEALQHYPEYAPEFLYKYQAIDDAQPERLEQILVQNELFFPSPSTFNDPFDCQASAVTFREYSDEEWRTYLEALIASQRPDLDEPARARWVEEKLKSGALRDADSITGYREELQEVIDRVGIYCLSEKWSDLLMWSHYAGGHTGFCLEFRFSPAFELFLQAQPVIYAESYPSVDFLKASKTQKFDATFLTKAEAWSYEEEWRVLDYRGKPGPRPYPPEFMTGVILGARIQTRHREKVLSLVRERQPAPIVYQAEIAPDKYAIARHAVTPEVR